MCFFCSAAELHQAGEWRISLYNHPVEVRPLQFRESYLALGTAPAFAQAIETRRDCCFIVNGSWLMSFEMK
jgi:hypothetical protein